MQENSIVNTHDEHLSHFTEISGSELELTEREVYAPLLATRRHLCPQDMNPGT